MATTSSERNKKARSRLKEQLGEEGLKQRDHEKYVLKKERAKMKRDLDRAMTFPDRLKLFLLYRDLKNALRDQFTKSDGRLSLSGKKGLDAKATELIKTLIQHRTVADFSVLGELLKRQKLFPEFEQKYFWEVSDKLTGDEAEIWEYLYYATHLQYDDVDTLKADIAMKVDIDPESVFTAYANICKTGATISGFEFVEMLGYRGSVSYIERGKSWIARESEFPPCSLTATLRTSSSTFYTMLLPDGKRVTTRVNAYE